MKKNNTWHEVEYDILVAVFFCHNWTVELYQKSSALLCKKAYLLCQNLCYVHSFIHLLPTYLNQGCLSCLSDMGYKVIPPAKVLILVNAVTLSYTLFPMNIIDHEFLSHQNHLNYLHVPVQYILGTPKLKKLNEIPHTGNFK